MELYAFFFFLLGTMIGSFLNVLIYRMHTGRSINGRSHCMSCGETLAWYELFPIVSYLVLRARCRYCSAYIPLRYLAVELLTGCLFFMVFTLYGFAMPYLMFYLGLTALLVVIVVYDMRHTIIPNELTLAVAVLAFIYVFFLGMHQVFPSLLAGLGAGGFFYLLWYASKGKWLGLGDARLALPLGMIAGPAAVVSMVVLSFWIGAAISLLLLLIKRIFDAGTTSLRIPLPRLTIQSEVPFAPFLILGFLFAHFFHADIFLITALLLPASF